MSEGETGDKGQNFSGGSGEITGVEGLKFC